MSKLLAYRKQARWQRHKEGFQMGGRSVSQGTASPTATARSNIGGLTGRRQYGANHEGGTKRQKRAFRNSTMVRPLR